MAFRYLTDPLFLACLCAYSVNWILERYDMSPSILQSYLNDLICLPFWIPIILWINRRLGVRRHDAPPLGYEIVIPLLIWAVVFELALPAMPSWEMLAFADPMDVLCYALGGSLAVVFWDWYYGRAADPARRAYPTT